MLTFLFYFRILICAIIIIINIITILGFSFLFCSVFFFFFLCLYYIHFKTVHHFKQYNWFSETPLIHSMCRCYCPVQLCHCRCHQSTSRTCRSQNVHLAPQRRDLWLSSDLSSSPHGRRTRVAGSSPSVLGPNKCILGLRSVHPKLRNWIWWWWWW